MKEFTLDNGMKVFIRENPGTKTVAIDAWVRTGSINEPPSLNGISHFLEHMLFKGTKKYKPGEIDRIVEGLGAVWNAGTSEDYTHFYLSVAAPYFAQCLDVMAEVLKNSVIDPNEVERERLVILEEYRRKQDNPAGFLFEQVYIKSYVKGPYRFPVLGTPDTLKAITPEDIQRYYLQYYTPETVTLVIVGDVKADEILPEVKKQFADFTRKHKPADVDYTTEYARNLRERYERQAGDVYLAMSFPAPGIDKVDDVCAMDVLSVILGEGRSSRLYRIVKEKKQLVSSIDVTYATQKLDSLFVVSATLNPDKLEKTEKAILTEIKRLRQHKPPRNELNKAKRMITNSYYFSTETNAGQAGIFGYYYTLTGSVEFEQKYLERINAVTPEAVQQVARKYLSPDAYNLFYIQPRP